MNFSKYMQRSNGQMVIYADICRFNRNKASKLFQNNLI